jgi:hypothetical protein
MTDTQHQETVASDADGQRLVTAMALPRTDTAGAGSPAADRTAAQAPPNFLRPNFERMPPELKQRPNWVLWVSIWNGSKWTKRPIQVSGFGASTTNPKHWSSFDEVKQAYERAIQRGYIEVRGKDKPSHRVGIGGVGFVFDAQPDQDGLVIAGVDFDKVITGSDIASFAEECIKRLKSYTERSVIRRRIARDRQGATFAERYRSCWRRNVHNRAFFHHDGTRAGRRQDRRCS